MDVELHGADDSSARRSHDARVVQLLVATQAIRAEGVELRIRDRVERAIVLRRGRRDLGRGTSK